MHVIVQNKFDYNKLITQYFYNNSTLQPLQ